MGALGFGPGLTTWRSWRRPIAANPGFDFAGGGLAAGATLTRSSPGSAIASSGTLAVAASNVARFDYDPASQLLRGLLLEPARTNLLAGSERFDDPTLWTGMTVNADVAIAPDGNTSGDRLLPSTSSTVQQLSMPSTAYTAGSPYTLSLFVKLAGDRYVGLRFPGNTFAASARSATFDLVTGNSFPQPGASTTLTLLGGGWWRCAMSATATATGSGRAGVAVNQSTANTFETWAGNGSDAILAFGAQLEAGAEASSYIATTPAGAATRAGDVVTLDWGLHGVGDGPATLRYTFDDGSFQEQASNVAGGLTTVPTPLARRWLRRVDKV